MMLSKSSRRMSMEVRRARYLDQNPLLYTRADLMSVARRMKAAMM